MSLDWFLEATEVFDSSCEKAGDAGRLLVLGSQTYSVTFEFDGFYVLPFRELRKVKELYKSQKKKLHLEEPYVPFVNADWKMEFSMEVSVGQVDERIAFGSMAKGQKRYGSTSTRIKRDETQGFPYTVQLGDTLQGLAVKFGVSTEQIRRTNQLWTNDSLFLRDKLIIPIHADIENTDNGQCSTSSLVSLSSSTPEFRNQLTSLNGSTCSDKIQKSLTKSDPPITPNGQCLNSEDFQSPETLSTGSRPWTHPLSDSFEFDDGQTSPSSIKLDSDPLTSPTSINEPTSFSNPNNYNPYQNGNGAKIGGSNRHGSEDHVKKVISQPYVVKDHSEKSVNEFLSRIDTAIASTREKTLPLKQSSKQWITFESDSESEQYRSSGSGVSVRSNGRQLRQSLQKLEKKQEEFFQL